MKKYFIAITIISVLAVFGFRLDVVEAANFGYTTDGSSTTGLSINYGFAFIAVAPEDGSITSITARSSAASTKTLRFKGQLLDNSGNSLGVCDEFTTTNTSEAWNTSVCSTPIAITSGTTYWIAIVSGVDAFPDGLLALNTGAGTNGKFDADNGGYASPGNWTSPTNQTSLFSIYATYTAGAGGSSPSVESDIVLFE